jgi:type I site-specific restriction endonuclease
MTADIPQLNFPSYDFEIIQNQQGTKIFDHLRKQFVKLTPEEWVRQNMVRYLTDNLKYPAGLIAIEKGMKVNGMPRRADIIIYDKTGTPWMIVECKAPAVKNVEEAAYQASNYSRAMPVKYIAVTNGYEHYCYEFINGAFSARKSFPEVVK